MALGEIPKQLRRLCEIHEWQHASGVLIKDFPLEWADVCEVVLEFPLRMSRVVVPGGGRSLIAGAIAQRGWEEKQFKTAITVEERTQTRYEL